MVVSRFSLPESTSGSNMAPFFCKFGIFLSYDCNWAENLFVNWVWVMVGGLGVRGLRYELGLKWGWELG